MLRMAKNKRAPGRPPILDEPMRQINVRLPESDIDWVEDYARQDQRSRNHVIRAAITLLRQKVEDANN